MGVIINCTESHLDFFTRNLTVCKGDQVATIHGYVSAERLISADDDHEEPLTVDEAKLHLNYAIEDHEKDEQVQAWIREARQQLEHDTGVILTTQTWRITIEQFPSFRSWLNLPIWPIQSVDAFTYVDRDGAEQDLMSSPSNFILSTSSRPAKLGLSSESANWPTSARKFQPGTLDVTAGFTSLEAVPAPLIAAIKKKIGDLANFRESAIAFAGLQVQPVPSSYEDLIAPWVLPVVG